MKLKDSIALVSGASSGIGYAAALALAKEGAHLVLLCRNPEKGEAAMRAIAQASQNPKIDLLLADLSDQESIRKVGQYARESYPKLDILINNAGAIFPKRRLSLDGLEQHIALNHMGYFLLTHQLMGLLRAGERKQILNLSSSAHKLVRKLELDNLQGEKRFGRFYQYGLSKLFNLYFTQQLAQRFGPDGFGVNALHPGVVNTNFSQEGKGFTAFLYRHLGRFMRQPEQVGQQILELLTADEYLLIEGQYFTPKGVEQPSILAQDQALAEQIWELSMDWGKIEEYGILD